MPESSPPRLESPEAPWRFVVAIVAGGVACVLLSVVGLVFFYQVALRGGPEAARPAQFPAPALETALFRNLSPQAPAGMSPPPGVGAAMAAVADRAGAAYDPPAGRAP